MSAAWEGFGWSWTLRDSRGRALATIDGVKIGEVVAYDWLLTGRAPGTAKRCATLAAAMNAAADAWATAKVAAVWAAEALAAGGKE